jgi:hypothetical protein
MTDYCWDLKMNVSANSGRKEKRCIQRALLNVIGVGFSHGL